MDFNRSYIGTLGYREMILGDACTPCNLDKMCLVNQKLI